MSARWAAETLAVAFERGDFSAATLGGYEETWRAHLGRELRVGVWVRRLAARLTAADLDALEVGVQVPEFALVGEREGRDEVDRRHGHAAPPEVEAEPGSLPRGGGRQLEPGEGGEVSLEERAVRVGPRALEHLHDDDPRRDHQIPREGVLDSDAQPRRPTGAVVLVLGSPRLYTSRW